MRSIVRTCAALLALALSACGDGSSHALPSITAGATAAPATVLHGVAKFSLLIPNSTATAKLTRKAQYISASTQSGTITVGGTTTELDLGSGSPLCTTLTSGRSCDIAVAAPIGTMIAFSVALYSGMFMNGTHQGVLLSSGAFTSAVVEGVSNVSVPLILGGVLSSYKLVVTHQPTMYDTTSVGTAVLDAYDPTGKLIVGSGTLTDTSGNATSVALASTPANSIVFSLDGTTYATSATIANTGAPITFKQNTDILGAQITVTAAGATQLATTWVRPGGFSPQYVEGNVISSSGTNQIAPFVDTSKGVAIVAENAPGGGIFTATTGTSVSNSQCSGAVAPALDMAYTTGTAWMAGYDGGSVLYTLGGSGTCGLYSQAPADTAVGIAGVGIEFIQYNGATTCQAGTMVPGVYVSLGSSAATCSSPHDLVVTNDGTGYLALETNTFGGDDHVIGFFGTTFTFDTHVTFGGISAAGGTLVSEAMRSDNTAYMHELANDRLWSLSYTTHTINGYVALPSAYTYVNHAQTNLGHAYSTRTIAIGSDGLAYIAISSPVNGLLVVDPDTGAVVSVLPNVSGASSSGVQQIAVDNRGSIYWSAGVYLMHYPSGLP